MVYVTVTQINQEFILVERPDAQRRVDATLCKIFNDLEKDGFTLVGAGGSDQLVFVFHKDGLAPQDEGEKVDKKEGAKDKADKKDRSTTPDKKKAK